MSYKTNVKQYNQIYKMKTRQNCVKLRIVVSPKIKN